MAFRHVFESVGEEIVRTEVDGAGDADGGRQAEKNKHRALHFSFELQWPVADASRVSGDFVRSSAGVRSSLGDTQTGTRECFLYPSGYFAHAH